MNNSSVLKQKYMPRFDNLWKKCQILPKSFLLIGSRRTKSEIDEQEKLREDIKRSEQKRRDKEKREAERLKFTEKTYSNLNKKSDVHQVRYIYIYIFNFFFPNFYVISSRRKKSSEKCLVINRLEVMVPRRMKVTSLFHLLLALSTIERPNLGWDSRIWRREFTYKGRFWWKNFLKLFLTFQSSNDIAKFDITKKRTSHWYSFEAVQCWSTTNCNWQSNQCIQ